MRHVFYRQPSTNSATIWVFRENACRIPCLMWLVTFCAHRKPQNKVYDIDLINERITDFYNTFNKSNYKMMMTLEKKFIDLNGILVKLQKEK